MKRKILYMAVFLLLMATLPWLLMQRGNWLPDKMPNRGVTSTDSSRQTFYKWQDAAGQWHFGDQVPEGVTAFPVNVDTAANIIQSVKAPAASAPVTPVVSTETTDNRDVPAALPGVPFTVNPADIPQLLEQAQQVQQQMGQRQQQLDRAR